MCSFVVVRGLTMVLQPGSKPVPNSPDYVLIRKLGAGALR